MAPFRRPLLRSAEFTSFKRASSCGNLEAQFGNHGLQTLGPFASPPDRNASLELKRSYFSLRPSPLINSTLWLKTLQGVDFGSIRGQFLVSFGQKWLQPTKSRPKNRLKNWPSPGSRQASTPKKRGGSVAEIKVLKLELKRSWVMLRSWYERLSCFLLVVVGRNDWLGIHLHIAYLARTSMDLMQTHTMSPEIIIIIIIIYYYYYYYYYQEWKSWPGPIWKGFQRPPFFKPLVRLLNWTGSCYKEGKSAFNLSNWSTPNIMWTGRGSTVQRKWSHVAPGIQKAPLLPNPPRWAKNTGTQGVRVSEVRCGTSSNRFHCMGSQHPSPNVKTLCNFEPQIWREMITSRDAESTCF